VTHDPVPPSHGESRPRALTGRRAHCTCPRVPPCPRVVPQTLVRVVYPCRPSESSVRVVCPCRLSESSIRQTSCHGPSIAAPSMHTAPARSPLKHTKRRFVRLHSTRLVPRPSLCASQDPSHAASPLRHRGTAPAVTGLQVEADDAAADGESCSVTKRRRAHRRWQGPLTQQRLVPPPPPRPLPPLPIPPPPRPQRHHGAITAPWPRKRQQRLGAAQPVCIFSCWPRRCRWRYVDPMFSASVAKCRYVTLLSAHHCRERERERERERAGT
jgi:hypothetical protein